MHFFRDYPCLTLGILLGISSQVRAEPLQYNRDIRPILLEHCFACHGADSAAREGDLRIDQRDAAIASGAIVPGKGDESELLRRILSDDPEEVMPPPKTKKTLSPEQKERLRTWINQGAEYELHWSYLAPVRSEIPATDAILQKVPHEERQRLQAWLRTPIDHFVLDQLTKHQLIPNGEADRRTLVRRLSFDLTGLPPDPKVVEDYLSDSRPDAYERLVDRLMESQAWGEHRGRYWLDYARYADTHGLHFDNFREMWSYRDWVIKALNANMPYDQFTIENIAGDLLPNATLDQRIGSGFNRCNMTTNEGGIIDEEYRVLYTRDRTETVSQVWMGLTANCAVCHSHKFDMLSQKEFYRLAAFFNNTTQDARDGNIKDTPPILYVPQERDRERWSTLERQLADLKTQVETRRASAKSEFEQWLDHVQLSDLARQISDSDLELRLDTTEEADRRLPVQVLGQSMSIEISEKTTWRDGPQQRGLAVQGEVASFEKAGDFESDQPRTCTAWVHLPANDNSGSILARIDDQEESKYRGWDFWMQRRQIGMHIVHAWPENGLKVVAKNQVPADQWVHVAVTYDGSRKGGGVKIYYNGEAQESLVENETLRDGVTKTSVPLRFGRRHVGSPFYGGIADLRVYRRVLSPEEISTMGLTTHVAGIVTKPKESRTEGEMESAYRYWLSTQDAPFRQLTSSLDQTTKQFEELKRQGTIAHVMQERPDAPIAFVLNRGEYDQRLDQVSPDTPAILPTFPDTLPRNRLGLAQWLVAPEHPLTSRVTVNRFWQEVFGTGLVRTTGDLGVSGELPSHPELLDWLAVEFRESGWNVKKLFKLMVMSSTYRQTSRVTPEKLERDPSNRWLSRGPRFRMDAEMVRDFALSASGLLVPKIGGPSVKPYQPEGVWEAIAMDVSNTRSYTRDSGENLYRRSMYTFVKRMAPPASMDIFNAPNREFCVVRRERTNTALQALVTLNDEQFVEAARHLAQKAIQQSEPTFDGRIDFICQRLLSRSLSQEERHIAASSFEQLKTHYQSDLDAANQLLTVGEFKSPDSIPPADLAAWTMLTNELMNLDEALNK